MSQLNETIPGGWSETRQAAPEIQRICDKVRPELEKKAKRTFDIYTAKSFRMQVVNGFLYIIKILVAKPDSCVHVEVLVPGQPYGEPGLMSYQDHKTLEDDIVIF